MHKSENKRGEKKYEKKNCRMKNPHSDIVCLNVNQLNCFINEKENIIIFSYLFIFCFCFYRKNYEQFNETVQKRLRPYESGLFMRSMSARRLETLNIYVIHTMPT